MSERKKAINVRVHWIEMFRGFTVADRSFQVQQMRELSKTCRAEVADWHPGPSDE